MALRLSPRLQRVLDAMPPEYASEPVLVALINAYCLDCDRIEDMLKAVQSGFFPQLADDNYRMLGMLEFQSGLPVEPVGATVSERRQKVMALRTRSLVAASDWVAAITEALGTTSWDHVEVPGRSVTIVVAYSSTGYQAGVLGQIARKITPAHMSVGGSYSQGFILGSSLLGVQAL